MIILTDNKNYAIRTCKESSTCHFVETTGGKQFGEMKLLSDAGYRVMVTGKEAEDYLDENNIYYIHIETVKKENFERWTKRLEKMIEDESDLLEMNNSSEKLIFAVPCDDTEKPTLSTVNLFELVRDNKTGDLHSRFYEEGLSTKDKIKLLKDVMTKMTAKFGYFGFGVEEGDFYDDINFSTGKSIPEIMGKLSMFIAVMEASIH